MPQTTPTSALKINFIDLIRVIEPEELNVGINKDKQSGQDTILEGSSEVQSKAVEVQSK